MKRNNLHMLLFISLFAGVGWLVSSCEDTLPDNPFDPFNQTDTTGVVVDTIDPNSIIGLHKNIFSVTCANSGCHDGTFEPDFRTVESSYNTLVNQPIIKNDNAGSYAYRVIPGDVNNSILHVRLTEDLNGNSGIMPLSIDPGSDWPDKKTEYIQNIDNWIQAGAKDMFGNSSTAANQEPQMTGVQAYADGNSSPVNRLPSGILVVPSNTNSLDVWFALSDDVTSSTNLTYNKVKFSPSLDNFDAIPEKNLTVVTSPKQAVGYDGSMVNYHHRVTVDPDSLGDPGTHVFMRIYIQDGNNGLTEIPAYESATYIKTYFTLKLD